MNAIKKLLLVVVLAGAIGPVLAHHSFAEYDNRNRTTVTGKLMSLEFANPHIQYSLEVIDPKTGKPEIWHIAGPAPTAWRAAGWKKSNFVIGEEYTVTGFPMRHDPHRLSTSMLKDSKGKVYGAELKY